MELHIDTISSFHNSFGISTQSAGMHRSFSAVLDPKHAKLVLEMDITDVCEGLYLCAYEALTEEKVRWNGGEVAGGIMGGW